MEWFQTMLNMASKITDFTQKLNIEDKTRSLKRKMETLAARENDIHTQLSLEEKRPGKKTKEEVMDWFRNFERLSYEVDGVVKRVTPSTLFWQLLLGSHLDKLLREAEQLHEEGRFAEGLTIDVEETQDYELPAGELVGQAFQSNLEKIWDYLTSEEVLSIGVQGMGGVGKTTLVTHIYNRIVNDRFTFESSCWVTVSQDCSVRKLQNVIAKHLRLDLENEDDEKIRAARLWRALNNTKSIIILDDVWEHYSLEKVGIPLRRNGCKLILTSRKKDLCYQMNCDKLVEVTTLSEHEAWYLFRDNLRYGSLLSRDVEEIAQMVARECAGLPLGIVVLSGIMRGVNDIHEWQNTLKELQQSKFRVERMEDEVFTTLRFSYQCLRDRILQECFLHVVLYPEDEEVDKEELIQYFVDSGLIERGMTRRTEFDKGKTILNKLVNSCLLEERNKVSAKNYIKGCVKMHDLVRDIGINITNNRFMVKAGHLLKEIPDESEWVESLEKVSLMANEIKEIAPHSSPRCPNISTLFLQMNPLVSISNSFFRHMQTLQILNLSCTNIEELPDSLSNLENLTALHLSRCSKLRFVPSLAKMQALRTLDLYESGIEEMPQGMERLRSLIYLDLGETKGLEKMQWPIGILPLLSHLQYLDFMRGPKIMKAEELMSLMKLERLRCWFDDANEFSTCMRYLRPHVNHREIALRDSALGDVMVDSKMVTVTKCNMEVRGESFRLPYDMEALYLVECKGITSMSKWETTFPELKKCDVYKCKGMEMMINDSQQCTLFPKLRELTLFDLSDLKAVISNSPQPAMSFASSNHFSSLTNLSICGCPRIKKLLTSPLLLLLTHVEMITIIHCEGLEEIIVVEDDKYPILGLPKLRYMELRQLPELRSVCGAKWTVRCDSLQSLLILDCPMLERIPMELHVPSNHQKDEDPIPSSLVEVIILSVPGWSDTVWKRKS